MNREASVEMISAPPPIAVDLQTATEPAAEERPYALTITSERPSPSTSPPSTTKPA